MMVWYVVGDFKLFRVNDNDTGVVASLSIACGKVQYGLHDLFCLEVTK